MTGSSCDREEDTEVAIIEHESIAFIRAETQGSGAP